MFKLLIVAALLAIANATVTPQVTSTSFYAARLDFYCYGGDPLTTTTLSGIQTQAGALQADTSYISLKCTATSTDRYYCVLHGAATDSTNMGALATIMAQRNVGDTATEGSVTCITLKKSTTSFTANP